MNPHGQCIDTSKSGGLNAGEFWSQLFIENELNWVRAPHKVLTDAQLGERVRAAFPERAAWSKNLTRANGWRGAFNRGKLAGRKPKNPSCTYVRHGDILTQKGPYGTIFRKKVTFVNDGKTEG